MRSPETSSPTPAATPERPDKEIKEIALSPWMTTDEAVEYFRLPSRRALYQRIRRGTIRCFRDGRRFLLRRDDLDALLTEVTTLTSLGKRLPSEE